MTMQTDPQNLLLSSSTIHHPSIVHPPAVMPESAPNLTVIAASKTTTTLAVATCPAPGSQLPQPVPACSPPVVTVAPPAPPILKGRPRTGAVACLPKDERDMVCRLIAKDVPYRKIVECLDHLGFELTERNISNWVTHGGYAEWCALCDASVQTTLRQDDLLDHHRSENSADLAEVGLQAVAVRLSEHLLREMSSSQDVQANLSKLEPVVNLLCRVNKELFNGQKYRDDCQTKIFKTPARIKAEEREKLAIHEYILSAKPKPKLPNAPAPGPNGSPAAPATAAPPPAATPSAAPPAPTSTPAQDPSATETPAPSAEVSSSETVLAPAPVSDTPPPAAPAQTDAPKAVARPDSEQ